MKRQIRLCLALLLSFMLYLAPNVQAAQDGVFYLAVMTANQTVIAPEPISYTEGQTVGEALAQSGHTFSGLEDGMIYAIDGVSASYQRYYDEGGFDLAAPADQITAMVFCVTADYSPELIQLVTTMGQYRQAENHVQNYPDASEAYAKALQEMRSADAQKAGQLNQALQKAVADYEAYLSGPKWNVQVQAKQNGKVVSNPTVTMTDAYGNVFQGKGTVSVLAGTYTYRVGDGGVNNTEGTVSVSKNMTLSVALPYGNWFGQVQALNAQKAPYESQPLETGGVRWMIDDSAGSGDVYLNAMQGAVPDRANTRLYAVYVDTQGIDHTVSYVSWESTTAKLSYLLEPGMQGRSFYLEARYAKDGVTMIQSYPIEVTRTASLQTLQLSADGMPVYLDFDPTVSDYTLDVVGQTLKILAEPFSADVTVKINGEETEEVTLHEGTNPIEISLHAADGSQRIYQLQVRQTKPAKVRLNTPAGVQAEIQDLGGNVIPAKDGVYALIPNQTYTCIGTKGQWCHAAVSFEAKDGARIDVPEPRDEDAIEALCFYDKSSVISRKTYAFDRDFTSSEHAYVCQVPDYASALYAQATAEGWEVTASYLAQSVEESKCGQPVKTPIPYPVQSNGTANYLSACLAASGYTQTLQLRCVSDEAGEITYYQDYIITFSKTAHIQSLQCLVDGEEQKLTDKNGAPCSFNRTKTEYYLQLNADAAALQLDGTFVGDTNPTAIGGGYHVTVGEEKAETLGEITIPLDEFGSQQEIQIKTGHSDEKAGSVIYTLHVQKVEPAQVRFQVTPSEATVFVTENLTGDPVYAEDGVYALIPGRTYTYQVTHPGYCGQKETEFTVSDDQTIEVSLQQAPQGEELPVLSAEWPSFRPTADNNAVIQAAIPTKQEDAVLYWASKIGTGWYGDACGCPILVDDALYLYAGSNLYRVNKYNGKIEATGQMDHSSSFSITNATYGDGMIFVGLSDGTVQAFRADTLESLWIYRDPLGGQPNCPLTYCNGRLYTGFWRGEEINANFVCLSVTDEDPASATEEKIASWTYTAKGGFYWSGAFASEDFVLVGTDDGAAGSGTGYAKLVTLRPGTGEIISQLQLSEPGDIRSSITYDAATDRYYFTTRGGYFYGVAVDDTGVIQTETLRSLLLQNGSETPGASTSTPTVYNGRAYVGVMGANQFAPYSGHNITVIDLSHWEIAYRVPTQGSPQTSGILTTAYEQEDGTVSIFYLDNYTPGKLRVIKDRPGQSAPIETVTELYRDTPYEVAPVLFTPYDQQAEYAICSPIIDEDGTIYFKNDSGYLMAVGSVPEKLTLKQPPEKLSYQAGETFDPAQMQVIATYRNGTERDVTSALQYQTNPLTEDDAQFELVLPLLYQNRDGAAGQQVEDLILTLQLEITAAEPEPEPELPFTDVPENSWYYKSVKYCVEKGLFSGITEHQFAPEDPMTRAMMVSVLWRMEGRPEPTQKNKFVDVPENTWYTKAVTWANQEGIVAGISEDRFAPNDLITREQIACIFYRFCKLYRQMDVSQRADLSEYLDVDTISGYAVESMQWANARGLVIGSNGKLSPRDDATRAQLASIFMRLLENVLVEEEEPAPEQTVSEPAAEQDPSADADQTQTDSPAAEQPSAESQPDDLQTPESGEGQITSDDNQAPADPAPDVTEPETTQPETDAASELGT